MPVARMITSWRRLRRDDTAATGLFVALLLPVLCGLGALAIDPSYLSYRSTLLRQTVAAAALAGASNLTTYYTSTTGSTASIASAAESFASANEPSQTYGTVVSASNVVVGNWNPTTAQFTSLASSKGTVPNAVQVTGLNTKANGNPVSMIFPTISGTSSMDMTRTAVASFGTGENFDTIILNDLSQSFSSEISEQRTADLSILNCINSASSSTSVFGLTTFDGHASVYQSLVRGSTNTSNLTTAINALNSCGKSGMPACSGSNVAAGLYSAIQQFTTVSSTNTFKNIIIITDGVPNASSSTTYSAADGVTCTKNCTDAELLAAAQTQANDAAAANISISTIYYSGDTTTSEQASYAASLASLKRGTGVSLVAPSATTITTVFGGFCATMTSALVSIN